jgi:hypothetical protein
MQSKYLISFRYKRNPSTGPVISHRHALQNTRPWLIPGTSYYNAEFKFLKKPGIDHEGKIGIWQLVLRLIEGDFVSDRYNLVGVSHTRTSSFKGDVRSLLVENFLQIWCVFLSYIL